MIPYFKFQTFGNFFFETPYPRIRKKTLSHQHTDDADRRDTREIHIGDVGTKDLWDFRLEFELPVTPASAFTLTTFI